MKIEIGIKVKCIGCGYIKIVGKEQKELPFCDKCGGVMIAEKAIVKSKKAH